MSHKGPEALLVNGFDTGELGLVVQNDLSGWRDGLAVEGEFSGIPGRVGTVPLAREPETTAREITVAGVQWAGSNQQLRQRLDRLKARLYAGTVEVSFSDDPDRFFLANTDDVTVTGIAPALHGEAHEVEISFFVTDPQIYERPGRVVDFTAARAVVPVGTGTSFPEIHISGPVTDPTVTYRDHRGETVETFGLTVSLGSGQRRVVDMETSQVRDGAGNSVISEWSSGDFFALSPEDAAADEGPFPTLEISPEPGEASARYRKAWI